MVLLDISHRSLLLESILSNIFDLVPAGRRKIDVDHWGFFARGCFYWVAVIKISGLAVGRFKMGRHQRAGGLDVAVVIPG